MGHNTEATNAAKFINPNIHNLCNWAHIQEQPQPIQHKLVQQVPIVNIILEKNAIAISTRERSHIKSLPKKPATTTSTYKHKGKSKVNQPYHNQKAHQPQLWELSTSVSLISLQRSKKNLHQQNQELQMGHNTEATNAAKFINPNMCHQEHTNKNHDRC